MIKKPYTKMKNKYKGTTTATKRTRDSTGIKNFGKETLNMAKVGIGTTISLGVMKSVKDAFQ